MGRPINKKFFGNLNAPYDDAQTGGPTGEGAGNSLSSITVGGTNSGYTTLPGVTLDAPTMPGGVQAAATATALMAVSATVATSGSGGTNQYYVPGQVLTVVGGTASPAATFTVASVGVRTAGANNTGTNYQPGDTFTFSGTDWSTSFTMSVAGVDANGSITSLSFTPNDGEYTGTGLTFPATATSQVSSSGTNATFDLGFGVKTVTLATGGSYSAVAGNPRTTTVSAGTGNGATLNVTYGIKTVTVTIPGSGYLVTPSAAFTGGTATATAVMAAGAGAGQSLKVNAKLPGGTSKPSDIMKQEASRRYLVRNTDGQGQCILMASPVLNEGEMNLAATDSIGGTYYVTKLTSRKAYITQSGSGPWEFGAVDGTDVVAWTVDAPSTGIVSLATD